MRVRRRLHALRIKLARRKSDAALWEFVLANPDEFGISDFDPSNYK